MATKFAPFPQGFPKPGNAQVIRAPGSQERGQTVHQPAPALLSNRQMAALGSSSALMAIGVVVVAALAWAAVFVPHPGSALAAAGLRFAFADALIRKDMLETAACEAVFAWVVVTIALAWWRGGVIAALFNPSPVGGRHGD